MRVSLKLPDWEALAGEGVEAALTRQRFETAGDAPVPAHARGCGRGVLAGRLTRLPSAPSIVCRTPYQQMAA